MRVFRNHNDFKTACRIAIILILYSKEMMDSITRINSLIVAKCTFETISLISRLGESNSERCKSRDTVSHVAPRLCRRSRYCPRKTTWK